MTQDEIVALIARGLKANGVTVVDVKPKALLVEIDGGVKLMIGTQVTE